jgi:hypothetical protein
MNIVLWMLLFAFPVYGEVPVILFDNRPEAGIPQEARLQERTNAASSGTKGTLSAFLGDSVKVLRVRYFNKQSWTNENQVREYLAALVTNKFTELYTGQVWSELVGIPEIECLVDFRKNYFGGKPYYEGRLLLWHTEACFRDENGRWWFVNIFDHFHRHHPLGTRDLVRKEERK